MSPKAAIFMAAVFNFLGVFVMTLINATVAETITKMVDFGSNSEEAIIALSAALFAIVLWATLAWAFGIPTSESHALIAGLTGKRDRSSRQPRRRKRRGMDKGCIRYRYLCSSRFWVRLVSMQIRDNTFL